jgi:hypothetical protein
VLSLLTFGHADVISLAAIDIDAEHAGGLAAIGLAVTARHAFAAGEIGIT